MKRLLAYALGAGLVFCSFAAEGEAQIQAVRTDDGFELRDGARKVLFYQSRPKSQDGRYKRAGYVHPLYDLDGHVLTEDFPADHAHHRGVFWAWHQLTVGGKQIGDPWVASKFLQRVDQAEVKPGNHDSLALHVRLSWVSDDWVGEDGQHKPVVREETVIRVFPATEKSRSIDFQIALTALEKDVRIGGSNDAKGYGGFSPRIRLPDGLRFLSEKGEVEPMRLSVDPSPWMDFSGKFFDGEPSGLTVLCHPTVPGFPQRWILRRKGSMQNPVYPGREPVALSREKPLVFRYRLVVHRGVPDAEKIRLWFREFSGDR